MPHGTLDEAVIALGSKRAQVSIGACLAIMLLMLIIFFYYYRISRRQIKLLRNAQQEADHANRAKSEFLSNMSHDIRTPMNAIMGMTAIAVANPDKPDQVQDCLRKIALSSKHLLGLINDVLDMSKIESGKLVLNRDRLSLQEVMEGIVSIVQPQIKSKRQAFDVFIQEIQTENVYADGVRLNQVLLNLLSNAMKFTPDGGSIAVTVSQEDSPKGSAYVRTHFRVRDTGIGMTSEFQKHIFESFVREDRSRVRKIEGTGLGMAITKYIVDLAEGSIEVKSAPNRGSEFHVILDLERIEDIEEEMVLPAWNMLVVDDDEDLCQSAAQNLREIGVIAEVAESGAQAIAMAEARCRRGEGYQVVLLDWKMPDMDGIETARRLRKSIGEDVPLLLISAYDWGEIEQEAREAGISGFIPKPLFKSTLYRCLSCCVGKLGEAEVQQEESSITPDFSGRRLLVAEDLDLNWEVICALLEPMGCIMEWAENGQICLEKFEAVPEGTYDAILMDLRMPVMSGFEATEAIRSLEQIRGRKRTPIIAMTADAFAEDIERCRACGMDGHIAKPLDLRELTRLLERLMRQSET